MFGRHSTQLHGNVSLVSPLRAESKMFNGVPMSWSRVKALPSYQIKFVAKYAVGTRLLLANTVFYLIWCILRSHLKIIWKFLRVESE